jgi:hypothetical protein
MEQETATTTTDRSCPMLFVILPAFVGGLIWLLALLGQVGN